MIMMNRLIYTFIALTLLVNCSVAQPGQYSSSDKKAIKAYEAARTCFNNLSPQTGKGDLECAKEQALKALDRDPKFTEAHILLSNVYIDMGEFDLALQQKEALFNTMQPLPSSEYFYTAKLCMITGRYEQCLKYANYYVKAQNTSPAFNNLCYKYIDNCNFALEAIKNPTPFDPVNLGGNINTNRPEYFPSITADDRQLLFTRDILDPREIYYGHQEEIIVSNSESPHEWTYGKGVSSNINTVYNEGAPTFSACLLYTSPSPRDA